MEEKQRHEEIAYQNKDITSKLFAEGLLERSFSVYGLNLPKVVQILPTNLPVIKANENRMDNAFLLEDNTILIVDYESAYKDVNKLKYADYIIRVLSRKPIDLSKKVRMVVIYTADVTRDQTSDILDVGAMTVKVEEAFLSEIDSNNIRIKLENRIRNKEVLTDEEIMEFVLYPLSFKDIEAKRVAIRESIELAESIDYYNDNGATVGFILAGIVVFSDKVIDDETKKQVKGWLEMTGIARLFEEEKMEAVRKAALEGEARGEAIGEAKHVLTVYQNCLSRGMSEDDARAISGYKGK